MLDCCSRWTSIGLGDLLAGGSARGSLVTLWVGVEWSALGSGPVWCPRVLVLGPVLFLVLINDLPGVVSSSVRLLAGGCVLCGSVGSAVGCRVLKDGLGGLSRWETGWQMGFNVGKCRSVGVAQCLPGVWMLFDYSLHRV